MSEKLHIPSHRYGNKKYREGWDRTFKKYTREEYMRGEKDK